MAGMKRKMSSGGLSAWSQPIKKRFKALKKPSKSKGYSPELKCLDIKPETVPINGAGAAATFSLLNAIQEGSSFYNRVGRKINLKSLNFTFDIEKTFANIGAVDPQYARVVVLYDSQPNGAAPQYSDVMQDVTQNGTPSVTVYSSVNLNNRDRFRVLMDRKIKLPGVGVSGAPLATGDNAVYEMNNDKLNITQYIKLGGIETLYKSSSSPSTIADISTGALWCMVVGQDTAVTPQQGWQGFLTTRLRYYDI